MKWIRWRRSARAAGPARGGEGPVDPPFDAAEAIDARLSRALDGDLTAAEVSALRAELDADPELRARMDGLAAVRTALDALGSEEELWRAPRSFALSPEQGARERGVSNRAPTVRAPGTVPRVPWLEWATRGGAVAAAVLFAAVLLTDAGNTPTDEPETATATAALAPQTERVDLFANDRAADTETVPESDGASEVGGDAAPGAAPQPEAAADPDTSAADAAADAAAESAVDDDVPLPAPSVAPEPAVAAEAEQGGDDEAAADSAEADGAQADGAEELAAALAPEASEDDGIGRPVLLGSLAALAVALAALAVALGRLRAREPSSLDRR